MATALVSAESLTFWKSALFGKYWRISSSVFSLWIPAQTRQPTRESGLPQLCIAEQALPGYGERPKYLVELPS